MSSNSATSPSLSSLSPWRLRNNLVFPHRTLRNREFRCWRRRRLKQRSKLVVLNEFDPPSPSPFDEFLSLLPLNFISPAALGFASGLGLSLSLFSKHRNGNRKDLNLNSRVLDLGEWILFTSPTPFNRFVLLRCPSISFKDSEFLEDVNDKLVKEDRHYVRLDSGRIQILNSGGDDEGEIESERGRLEYQRVCVGAEDGGVISLDWPANLDMNQEQGLDTTFVIVPGTAEGSMDENVKGFVCECLRRGVFPVVMNPRGCAGSPLTTARLFTAADSDDICSAIQYISRARPWSTLMGIGWGYGANMLTKYLAEVGEKTPLTAATCIDNPFDLDEATRTSPLHTNFYGTLTKGLVNILEANKELFQGRSKGFNVEKAISAGSVREFEKAISMVSYGFDTIEDFYSKTSTRSVVGNLKIPVLFIQKDDGNVPLFSIPRGLIAENPFTSLLLCSCSPSTAKTSDSFVISWCQQVIIEWLAAVELGLLKGRHPLLQDVDITINPSTGLALVEGRMSDRKDRFDSVLNLAESDSSNEYSYPLEDKYREGDDISCAPLKLRWGSNRTWQVKEKEMRKVNGAFQQTSSINTESLPQSSFVNGESLQQTSAVNAQSEQTNEADPVDVDRGQVLQTAEVVMNMLNVTMPGTLKEEEKRKVLTAVGQGETLLKALQDAVPEDVRGKLTTSVSEILQVRGTNLNLDGLLNVSQVGNVSSGLKSKVEEKIRKRCDPKNGENANDLGNSQGNSPVGVDEPLEKDDVGVQPQEKSQKSLDLSESESDKHNGDDCATRGSNQSQDSRDTNVSAKDKDVQVSGVDESGSESLTKTNSSGFNHDNNGYSEEKVAQLSQVNGSGSESLNERDSCSYNEKPGSSEGVNTEQENRSADDKINEPDNGEDNYTSGQEGKPQDSSKVQRKTSSLASSSEALAHSSPDSQLSEKGDNVEKNKDDKLMQPVADDNKATTSDSKAPTFSVSQAFDTLTGLDDSTQMAVNSVFGVIEDMITQLEERRENGGTVQKVNGDEAEINDTVDGNNATSDESLLGKQDGKPQIIASSDMAHDHTIHECSSDPTGTQVNAGNDQADVRPLNIDSVDGKIGDGRVGSDSDPGEGVNHMSNNLAVNNIVIKNDGRHVNSRSFPLYMDTNSYRQSYILSKVKKAKSFDFDATTAPSLDYIPEEECWKLLEQSERPVHSISQHTDYNSLARKNYTSPTADDIIEPSYVILDSERQQESVEDLEMENLGQEAMVNDDGLDESVCFVKNIVLDSLKVEVSRRLSTTDMKDMEASLAEDMEELAHAVALAVLHDKEPAWHLMSSDVDNCVLNGKHVTEAVSLAIQKTSYLRRVLPVGVIVGSTLASLRKYCNVAVVYDNSQTEALFHEQDCVDGLKLNSPLLEKDLGQAPSRTREQRSVLRERSSSDNANTEVQTAHEAQLSRDRECTIVKRDEGEAAQSDHLETEAIMVGAVTAALGASALLSSQQDAYKDSERNENSAQSIGKRDILRKDPVKLEEAMADNQQSSIVTSLTEKAMSVAAPVVPVKEGGEVDHERLVAMLAELGQRGGILKLVGKIALLWGGLRGAMSLTDRLISFFRIAERPLLQRVLGFACMVLVLWSPVLVPLLPALVHSWSTHNSSRVAELACVLGLYAAVTILIVLWGKRIRGHEIPLKQYGLDMMSSQKIQDFLIGLSGGVMLVLSIQSVNAFVGLVKLSWPSSLFDVSTRLKTSMQLLIIAGQGIVTASCVAFVEELFFRSWLPEEIATELGYHWGIIISGLAFSLSQRSLLAIPGLWLLSFSLAGVRQRKQGSLFLPIGLRSGIMFASFLLQRGGFLIYQPRSPHWLALVHPFQPFSGVVGLIFSLLLALPLYPRDPFPKKKIHRTIRG